MVIKRPRLRLTREHFLLVVGAGTFVFEAIVHGTKTDPLIATGCLGMMGVTAWFPGGPRNKDKDE